ncbi:MAG: dTDP-4-dehydrorhamnose 3,5-epimerase [Polyangiales bacterium]
MNVVAGKLHGVFLIEPKVFGDERGYFMETYSRDRYRDAGIGATFVQDNVSRSSHAILRGLHIQHPNGQGKLCSVLIGEVFDVAVDLRVGSKTFGQWEGYTLSAENKRQLYIPPGFAHGFCVTGDDALFSYKCSEFYSPNNEFSVAYNDPDLGIEWPILSPTVSEKDAAGYRLKDIPKDRLPRYE